MKFAASIDALLAWRTERMPPVRFLALAIFLIWAASLGEFAHPTRATAVAPLVLALIAQFRLWDDLVDRGRDRVEHPERVLATISDTRTFVRAVCFLAAANLLAIGVGFGGHRALGFVALTAGAALWYPLYRGRGIIHSAVLNLKYPAFVLLVSKPRANPIALAIAAASVYGALLAFELLDEPALRTRVHGALRYLPFAAASIILVYVANAGVP